MRARACQGSGFKPIIDEFEGPFWTLAHAYSYLLLSFQFQPTAPLFLSIWYHTCDFCLLFLIIFFLLKDLKYICYCTLYCLNTFVWLGVCLASLQYWPANRVPNASAVETVFITKDAVPCKPLKRAAWNITPIQRCITVTEVPNEPLDMQNVLQWSHWNICVLWCFLRPQGQALGDEFCGGWVSTTAARTDPWPLAQETLAPFCRSQSGPEQWRI